MSSLERHQFHQSVEFLASSNLKLTDAMRKSLRDFSNVLTCPLCQAVMQEPVTITCGHTFCCTCIDRYTDNQWTCPVKSCGMSVAMKAQDSKFRRINPSHQTVIGSWNTICQTLRKAPDRWWQDADDEELSEYETADSF